MRYLMLLPPPCAGTVQLFLGEAMEQGHVVDGVVAQDRRQMDHFWAIREGLAQALKGDGYVYKYDVSLPVPVLYKLVGTRVMLAAGMPRSVCEGVCRCACHDAHAQGPLQVTEMKARVQGVALNCVGYGHLGDGTFQGLEVCAGGWGPTWGSALTRTAVDSL